MKTRLRAQMTSLSKEEWSLQSYNIRTQHSLCYGGLRNQYDLVGGAELREFATTYGWRLSTSYRGEADADTILNSTWKHEDDRIFYYVGLNRLRMLPPDTGLTYESDKTLAIKMHADYECFKKKKYLMDFTGMIEQGILQSIAPRGLKYILVDEAQDMCRLLYEHHKVLYRANPDAKVMWYGDDDQAVYEFMGADPSIFVQQEAAEVIYGEVSRRMPLVHGAKAHTYISKNRNRLPKSIVGSRGEGVSTHALSLEDTIDLVRGRSGEILWLTPTNHQAAKTREKLREAGISLKKTDEEREAITLLQWLHTKPKRLKLSDLKLLTETTLGGRKLVPFERRWFTEPHKFSKQVRAWISGEDPFDILGLSPEDPRLGVDLQEILRTGALGKLFTHDGDTVRVDHAGYLLATAKALGEVEVTTYHKSKGREADTVVVLKDVSGKMLESILYDPEAGRRLGFVAMTRSKNMIIFYRDEYGRCKDFYEVTS